MPLIKVEPTKPANEYWLGVEFKYQPRCAFAEVLAPFEEQLTKQGGVAVAGGGSAAGREVMKQLR